MALGGDEA